MKKILVVDNHPVMLKFMSKLLEKEGHHVLTAEDGLSALEILKTYIPDIIFVDLVMPNIDGRKLCLMIRGMEDMKDVCLIIISGIAAEKEISSTSFGADGCIAKGPLNKMGKHILSVLNILDKGSAADLSKEIIGLEDVYDREVTTELLSAMNHSELIFDNMEEGIIELTSEGKIVYVNPKSISIIGISEGNLLGSNFIELFNDRQGTEIKSLLETTDESPLSTPEDSPLSINNKLVLLDILKLNEENRQTIVVIVHDITKRRQAEEALLQEKNKLQDALARIKTLSGMLPICASCKKIRDDKGYWNQIEEYIESHSDAQLSHGLCPHCIDKLYGDEDWYKKEDFDE